MTQEFNAQEIHFLKTAVEGAQIQGKDSIFTATVLMKMQKWLEAQAETEGLLANGNPKPQGSPAEGSINNPHPEGAALPQGAPPIPAHTHAGDQPEGTNQ
tara:strand:+ start:678 stop:977 length:300 start_codon:yes stop_codon:yes gene_type:complete